MKDYPDIGELVLCNVKKVKRFGVFLSLDEYNNKEGFIHITEIASGWVKYIKDHIRENQKVVCKVMKIDKNKGQIDLSLKRVNAHQKRDKIKQWKDEGRATKLFSIICEKSGLDLDKGYKEFGNDLIETYGSMYSAFEEIIIDENTLKKEGFSGDWVDIFINVAKENIQIPTIKISGYLQLYVPTKNGINDIKKALKSIEKDVEIQYVGAPWYRLNIEAEDYKEAEQGLKTSAEKVIDAINKCGGMAEFQRKR